MYRTDLGDGPSLHEFGHRGEAQAHRSERSPLLENRFRWQRRPLEDV